MCLPGAASILPQAARAILNTGRVSGTLNYGNFQINSVSGAVWCVTDTWWVNLFPAEMVWMAFVRYLSLKTAAECGLG